MFSRARFRVVACGRRWGKTSLAKIELAAVAGAGKSCAYFAPDYKRVEEVWSALKSMLGPVMLRKDEQLHRLELTTGGVIELWTLADDRAGASRSYYFVVIDEAAHAANLEDVWTGAIRPSLIDQQGKALFISTPRGHNYFWTLWLLGRDPLETEWAEFQMPTITNTAIPGIDIVAEVEAARRTTPELVFREEYLAEFIAGSGQVFRRIADAVKAAETDPACIAAIKSAWNYEAVRGHQYIFGVDLAKSNDFSVFAIYDVTIQCLVYLDRGNHVDYQLQLNRLKSMFEIYKPTGIIIEQNAQVSFVEQADRAGLPIVPFQTSQASKAMIIEHLAAAFDNGAVRIVNDQVLVGELEGFEMTRLGSGQFRYAAPGGLHDDTVMAFALAYYGATYGIPDWGPEVIDMGETAEGQGQSDRDPILDIEDRSWDIVDWPTL